MLPARAAANDRPMMEACVECSMVELFRTGTTTVMEIGSIGDTVADAAERTGLRAYVAEGYRSGRWTSDDGRSVRYGWDEANGMRGFEAATLGGAKMLHRPNMGRIAPGCKADLLAWSLRSLFMVPLRDPIRNLVYSAQAEDLLDAMVDGRRVMRERAVLNADERAVADRLQREGERMWPRMHAGDWAGRDVDGMSPLTYPAFDPERA